MKFVKVLAVGAIVAAGAAFADGIAPIQTPSPALT
jgi:hypothetical protein